MKEAKKKIGKKLATGEARGKGDQGYDLKLPSFASYLQSTIAKKDQLSTS